MKKLMITACAIAITAVAQASTVVWGGAFATVDNEYITSGKAYLVFSATAFDPSTPTKVDGLTVGDSLDNGGKIVQAYTFEGADLENAVFTAQYEGDYNKISGYYGVLIKDDNNAAGLAWHNAGQATFKDELANPVDMKYNADWLDEAWMGETGFNVAVAPEPTSGLLLLLGVAGLALRRRRA